MTTAVCIQSGREKRQQQQGMKWIRRKRVEITQAEVAQLQALEHQRRMASIERVIIPSRYHQGCRVLTGGGAECFTSGLGKIGNGRNNDENSSRNKPSSTNWMNSVSVSVDYTPILLRSVNEDDYRYRMVGVCASSGPSLRVFDIENGKILYSLAGHASAIFAVQISNPLVQSRTLPVFISGSQDGLLKVWDLQTGNEIHSIGSGYHTGPVRAVYVYEGLNPQLYSATNQTVWVWLLESGELIRSIKTDYTLLSLHVYRAHEAFQDEENPAVLLAGTSNGLIVSWHLDSSIPSHQYTGHHGPVHTLTSTTLNQLKILISGGFDGNVKLWNMVTGQLLYSIHDPQHTNSVHCIQILPTPQVGLVVGYNDGTISVIDIRIGMKLFELRGHTDRVTSVACTVHPRPFIISCSRDGTVQIWDLRTAGKEEVESLGTNYIREGLYRSLQWSDDGQDGAKQTRVNTSIDTDSEPEEES